MLGIRIRLDKNGYKIDSSRIEIAKETAKRYELEETNHCIDYLTFVHKEEVGIIRKYYSRHSMEAVLFEIDDGTKEQEGKLIKKMLKDIAKELEDRQELTNKMIDATNKIINILNEQ